MTPAAGGPSVIRAEQAVFRIGEAVLLDGIDLDILAGELVVALGPNGAGKSSLLKLLSGELVPQLGSVSLDNHQVHSIDPEILARRFAVLPQATQLNFPFTVHEVVGLGRIPHKTGLIQDQQIIDTMLQIFSIQQYANRDYLTLSGGEQQRVQLARVCVQIADIEESGFLLLDEPTAALDLAHQHAVLSYVQSLSRQEIGVFAVLHDMNLAARYADRIILLDHGRIVSQGTPAQVLTCQHLEDVFAVNIRLIDLGDQAAPHIVAW